MMFVGPTSKDPLLLVGTLQHVGRTQTRAQAEGTKDIDSVGVCAHHRKGTGNSEDIGVMESTPLTTVARQWLF